jgi:hypothetical protein
VVDRQSLTFREFGRHASWLSLEELADVEHWLIVSVIVD